MLQILGTISVVKCILLCSFLCLYLSFSLSIVKYAVRSKAVRMLRSWLRFPTRVTDVCERLLCLCCPAGRWRPCVGLIPRARSPFASV
jgi:hypothetical protein